MEQNEQETPTKLHHTIKSKCERSNKRYRCPYTQKERAVHTTTRTTIY